MRGKCDCGNLVEKSHTLHDGTPVWSDKCRSCRGRYRYGIRKGNICEECGFVPKAMVQLQIDHVDGNRSNNDPSNLRTLCCNCHALKSHVEHNMSFPAEKNPFYGKNHSAETLEKIRRNSHK